MSPSTRRSPAVRLGLFLLPAALLLALCGSIAQARSGKIGGSLGALPQGAEFPGVMAVSPQGKIGAFALTSDSGAFDLSVPSGTYVIASSAADGESDLSAFSTPERVKPGHKVSVRSKLKLRAKAAASHAGLLAHGSILTITSFEFTNDLSSPTNAAPSQLRNLLINDLFAPCTDAGMVFVDTSPEFVAFAKQEKGLSDAGMLAVPFEYKPLKPQYEVFGAASVEDKGVGDELRLSLVATTVAHLDVQGSEVSLETTFPDFEFEDLKNSLAQASKEFAAKTCGA